MVDKADAVKITQQGIKEIETHALNRALKILPQVEKLIVDAASAGRRELDYTLPMFPFIFIKNRASVTRVLAGLLEQRGFGAVSGDKGITTWW